MIDSTHNLTALAHKKVLRPYGPARLDPLLNRHHQTLPAAEAAFEHQRARSAARGQHWTDKQADVFRALHTRYLMAAEAIGADREAWPLSVGVGKTQSIVSLVWAQCREKLAGRPYISILVCMERIEQMAELHAQLVEAGVAEDFVAVHHTMKAKEVDGASWVEPVPVSAIAAYPVLLCSHGKMLKDLANIAKVNTYAGTERDLVIWDESLIKSRGVSVDLDTLEATNAAFGIYAKYDTDASEAHAFFTERLRLMRDAFEKGDDRTIKPFVFAKEDGLRFDAAVARALRRGKFNREVREHLGEFTEHTQRPLRVLQYTNEGRKLGLIYFDTLIPPSLKRLIVLDASHNIRLLVSRHDKNITVTEVDCAVKRFDNVTVKAIKLASGKDSLYTSLPRADSVVMREVVDAVNAVPGKVLIITFGLKGAEAYRDNKASHADLIRRRLEKEGVDLDRVSWLTWGRHTGINGFKEADHVILVGVLRRDLFELRSAIAGQRGEIDSPHAESLKEAQEAQLSEMFHSVNQGGGRGKCRHTANGQAGEMRLTVICNDLFPVAWWNSAMPGVKLLKLPKERALAVAEDERVVKLRAALEAVPQGIDTVSSALLRKLAGLEALADDVYARLLKKLHVAGWTKAGRGFTREPFGFKPESGYDAVTDSNPDPLALASQF